MLVISSHRRGDAVVLCLKGSLSLDNTFEVERALNEQTNSGQKTIAFDLKDLNGLDSSGLGLFLRLHKESARNGIDLVFLNITETIVTLFDISKLNNFFNIMTEEDFLEQHSG